MALASNTFLGKSGLSEYPFVPALLSCTNSKLGMFLRISTGIFPMMTFASLTCSRLGFICPKWMNSQLDDELSNSFYVFPLKAYMYIFSS
ncbi:MAG: hypothetical protein ACLTTH_08225 [Holdemanella porci]